MPVPVRRDPLRRSIRLCSRGVTPHYPHNAAAGPGPPGRPPPRSNGRLPRPGRAPSPGAGQSDPREAAARGRVNGAATAAGARRGAALEPSGSRGRPRPRAFRPPTPHLLTGYRGSGTPSRNLTPLPFVKCHCLSPIFSCTPGHKLPSCCGTEACVTTLCGESKHQTHCERV